MHAQRSHTGFGLALLLASATILGLPYAAPAQQKNFKAGLTSTIKDLVDLIATDVGNHAGKREIHELDRALKDLLRVLEHPHHPHHRHHHHHGMGNNGGNGGDGGNGEQANNGGNGGNVNGGNGGNGNGKAPTQTNGKGPEKSPQQRTGNSGAFGKGIGDLMAHAHPTTQAHAKHKGGLSGGLNIGTLNITINNTTINKNAGNTNPTNLANAGDAKKHTHDGAKTGSNKTSTNLAGNLGTIKQQPNNGLTQNTNTTKNGSNKTGTNLAANLGTAKKTPTNNALTQNTNHTKNGAQKTGTPNTAKNGSGTNFFAGLLGNQHNTTQNKTGTGKGTTQKTGTMVANHHVTPHAAFPFVPHARMSAAPANQRASTGKKK